jgi:hypothetical protein
MAEPPQTESVWDEFNRSIPDLVKARVELGAWANAWGIVLEIADRRPDATPAMMVRAFYVALRDRGMSVPWPRRFGNPP